MKSSTLISKLLLLCITGILATACQTSSTALDSADGSAAGSGYDASVSTDGASPIAFGSETESAQAMLENTDSLLAKRVIYFDFDSAKIDEDSLKMLEAHGNFIASNSDVSVRLEGHADERGSREYNVALGDRRAQSVRRVLLSQGASVDQLETISYGEEQPAELGHDEAAWSKNRRVELVYDMNN